MATRRPSRKARQAARRRRTFLVLAALIVLGAGYGTYHVMSHSSAAPAPTPTPSASPSPTATPSASASPTPSASPSATASATPSATTPAGLGDFVAPIYPASGATAVPTGIGVFSAATGRLVRQLATVASTPGGGSSPQLIAASADGTGAFVRTASGQAGAQAAVERLPVAGGPATTVMTAPPASQIVAVSADGKLTAYITAATHTLSVASGSPTSPTVRTWSSFAGTVLGFVPGSPLLVYVTDTSPYRLMELPTSTAGATASPIATVATSAPSSVFCQGLTFAGAVAASGTIAVASSDCGRLVQTGAGASPTITYFTASGVRTGAVTLPGTIPAIGTVQWIGSVGSVPALVITTTHQDCYGIGATYRVVGPTSALIAPAHAC